MAINFITAELTAEKNLIFSSVPPINRGEHKTTIMRISVNPNFTDYSFSLEFLCPKNFKYATSSIPLDLNGEFENTLVYHLDSCLLQRRGRVYVQLRAEKIQNEETLIFKSIKCADASFEVLESIDGVGEPYATNDLVSSLLHTMSEAQLLCATATETAQEVLENAQNGVYNCEVPFITVRAETLATGSQATVTNTGQARTPIFVFGIPKGDQGEKGDRGDPGEVITQSDINNLFI